ncbi:TetR/AcrR family transcriptional regulator [Actinomadura barringtoniae]|uniref:TetR/AcrR family transcriptional regulator n=1 Tax=Actinomadura barringtoniae TaxID=1427535 RepID=A0A939TD07_9ACTN|nr:TetR/AcrR family transcriptional regulator [Actinomadura barringtoniae]MBO2451810.1 TetR/AcrR family transcriptional regulator [Actinomadura barringtoniae]
METERRPERADAARNRRAILRATEELLRDNPPEQVSVERVAAAAGVGKGTVFHRFGSRIGLIQELLIERAQAFTDSLETGPPPLGPGAPAGERLLAFVDAAIELIERNIGLMVALEHAAATSRQEDRDSHPVYGAWHRHVSALLAEAAPGVDAEVTAHLLLGALHSDPVVLAFREGEGERVAAALRVMVNGLIDR